LQSQSLEYQKWSRIVLEEKEIMEKDKRRSRKGKLKGSRISQNSIPKTYIKNP